MIEGGSTPKHDGHIGNAVDIPAAYILIEGTGGKKHETHIRNAADIPAAYILSETSGADKHAGHIGNVADIPAAYILIEANSAIKHAAHICNAAGAGRGGVGHGNIVFRPFGIFNTTYCAFIAKRGIGTANSYAIAMEEEGFSRGIWVCWIISIASSTSIIIAGAMR